MAFFWQQIVQLALEVIGIVIAMMASKIEGAQTAGHFLVEIHAVYLITVFVGMALYDNTYSPKIVPELRLAFAGMFVFCLVIMAAYFMFVIRITNPSAFDIVLYNWKGSMYFVMIFYIGRLIFFTFYAYKLFDSITGGRIQGGHVAEEMKEMELVRLETPKIEAKPAVPIYLMDYEKMIGKK